MSYQDAFSRVSALPAVCGVADLCRQFGMTEPVARHYLQRWTEKRLLQAAGKKIGLYYNIAKYPDSPMTYRHEVIARLYPSATLIGATVLNAHGWMTQVPWDLQVAVSARPRWGDAPYPDIAGAKFYYRPAAWYKKTAPGRFDPKNSLSRLYNLPSLSPAFALVDALRYGDSLVVDMDEIDLPEEAEKTVYLAATLLFPEGLPAGVTGTSGSKQRDSAVDFIF